MNSEKLLKLLDILDFKLHIQCNEKWDNCECHTALSIYKCCKLKEMYYNLVTDNGTYTIYLIVNNPDFVQIDFVLNNGVSEKQLISIKDFNKKMNEYPEFKKLIRISKINSINKMINNTLIEKSIKEYRYLLNLIGFKNIYSNLLYRDIYVFYYDNKDYTVIINNDDVDSYSNVSKIETKYFDNITQSRGGANWHNNTKSIKNCILWIKDDFKSLIRQNKIKQITK